MSSVLPSPSDLTFGTSATLPMSLTLEELSQLATAEDEDWSEDIFDHDDEIGGASPLSAWSSAPSSPVGHHVGDGGGSELETDGNVSDASSTGSCGGGGGGGGGSRKGRGGTKGLLAFKVPEPAVPMLPMHHQAGGGHSSPPMSKMMSSTTPPMMTAPPATTTAANAAADAPQRGKPASFMAQHAGQGGTTLPGPSSGTAGAGPMGAMPMGGPLFNPWAFPCYNPMAFAAAAAAAANASKNNGAALLPTTSTSAARPTAAGNKKRDLDAAASADDIESGAGSSLGHVNAADVGAAGSAGSAGGTAAATPADPATSAAGQIRKRQKAEEREDRRRRNREAADRSRNKRRALLAKLPQEKRELEEKMAQMEKELAAAKAENRSLIEQNTFLRSLLIKQQPGVVGAEGANWGGKVPATSEELGEAAAASASASACTDPNASPAGMMLMAVACLLTITHLTAFFDTDGQATFLNSSTEAMSHGVSTGRVLLSYDGDQARSWASGRLVYMLQVLFVVVCAGAFVPRGVRSGVSQLRSAALGVASLPLWNGSGKAAHVD